MIKIAPSILAADPLHLGEEVRRAEKAGCDWIHVDIMDGHFVPNLAFSPAVVAAIRRETSLPLDVHLMMDDPGSMLDAFLSAGADSVTIHAEIRGDLPELLGRIHAAGSSAGIAIKPATPVERVIPYFEQAEMILAMTVEPGFGGQQLDARVPEKISALRQAGYTGEIEADGGIREDNLKFLTERGLTVAVMGTALFRNEDMEAAVRRMHEMTRN